MCMISTPNSQGNKWVELSTMERARNVKAESGILIPNASTSILRCFQLNYFVIAHIHGHVRCPQQ